MRHTIRHSARLALLWQTAAGILLGGSLLLIIVLYPQNTFGVPFIWLLVVALIYTAQLGSIAAQHQRQVRFLEPLFQDQLPTSLAPTQPTPEQALPYGSSITLRYQRQPLSLLKTVLIYSIRLLIATACFEVALLSFTPDALPNFFSIMTGVPLLVQWGLLALPPLLWALLSLRMLRNTLRTSTQSLTLDDRGITRQRPWGQAEFIAWHEIRAWVRVLLTTGDQTLGSYLLYDPERYLEITFSPIGVLSGRQSASDYQFSPDQATYRVMAEQALATIMARTAIPLRVVSTAYYSKRGRYSSYTIGVAAQDVARQPEAPPAYQPPPQALEWARAYPGSYALPVTQDLLMVQPVGGARVALGWLARGLLIVALGIILFFLLIQLVDLPTALLITLLLMLPGFFFLTRAARQVLPRPVVIEALPAGLSRKGPGPRLFIPWNQVQAWGVVLPITPQKQPVYAVLWSGATLVWAEPEQATLPGTQGDGRAAYLAASQALHALIAVHTGQPMRILNQ
jgi:hypothetical protein